MFLDKLGRTLIKRFAEKARIIGYRKFCPKDKNNKRALLSYLILPLLPPHFMRERIRFSNRGMAQEMARALNELGYVVDIVNMDNVTWHPKRGYDLFIGHGGINYEHISRQLAENTVRIYFSTGIYWKDFNVREATRFFDLANRRGYFLQADRAIIHSEEFANQHADGIISLGGNDSLRTYSGFPCAIGINGATYPVTWRGWSEKDYKAGRQHFLFFSGDGNVHKGLDLLLEAFIQTDLHLHICQRIEPTFSSVYQQELASCPNIHTYNFIKMRSPEFIALVNRCNWIISATCAEGSPGAVIECMAHGLIPILPDSANISLGEWGIRLPECSVEAIRTSVIQASEMQAAQCHQRAKQGIEATRTTYSVDKFRDGFKQAVELIVKDTLLTKQKAMP